MKRLVFMMIMMMSGLAVQAQSASQMIKNVRAYYQEAGAIETKIAFTIDIPESEPTVMEGDLFLKGDKYRFVLDEQEFISDDVNQWHWTKADINEVQVSYIDENDTSTITPSKIFSQFLKGFGYKLVTKSTFKGRDVALIVISPDQKIEGNNIYKIKAVIDMKTNELVEMKLHETSGIVYHFQVLEQKKTTLKDSFFKFNEEENSEVEVIDLR